VLSEYCLVDTLGRFLSMLSGAAAMAARVYLDKPHTYFTNLDYITGKVILQLNSDTSIQAIHVKLEGESRTRLSGPRPDRSDKKKTEVEVHKVSSAAREQPSL
jgi:hypothetical protein